MSLPQLNFISDAQIDLDEGSGIVTAALTDLDVLRPQTKIRIRTVAPADGYFYVPLLDAGDSGVTVLEPANGVTRVVVQDEAVSIPDDADAWVVVPVAGQLRLVVSATPMTAADWALLPGRDGDAVPPVNSDGGKTAGPPGPPPVPPS
jgi:hypothetical protein